MRKKSNIEKDLKNILSKLLKLKINEITDKTDIYNTTEWDSIIQIELIVKLEEKFKIKFSQSEISKLNSYLNILKILKKKGN